MTQPTVFVTYVPKRALDRRAAMAPVRKPDAVMALLAGVMVVGGTVAALTPAVSQAAAPNGMIMRVTLPEATHFIPRPDQQHSGEPSGSGKDIMPDVVTEGGGEAGIPGLSPIPSDDQKPARMPPGANPGQRRDLEGFLDERGLRLLPVREPAVSDPGAVATGQMPQRLPVLAAADQSIDIVTEHAVNALGPVSGKSVEENAQSYPNVFIGGRPIGAVTMRGDRLHLGSLVGLLNLKLPGRGLNRLGELAGADTFVALKTIAEAGIVVSFDEARGRLTLDVQ